jgi:manganese efflux pump family protein
MSILPLLLFVLPLGLDTLGVSISLGIKSQQNEIAGQEGKGPRSPTWVYSAILFSLAETLMPLAGLVAGYAASLLISNVMHVVGPLLLIGVGLWELQEEAREYIHKRKRQGFNTTQYKAPLKGHFQWRRQLLLALSISLDELAIGFSLGTITISHPSGKSVNPIVLCILIGIQGFFMTLIGITLGRTLRTHLRAVKEWSEFLSAFLLIGLGIWLFVT